MTRTILLYSDASEDTTSWVLDLISKSWTGDVRRIPSISYDALAEMEEADALMVYYIGPSEAAAIAAYHACEMTNCYVTVVNATGRTLPPCLELFIDFQTDSTQDALNYLNGKIKEAD